MTVRFVIRDEDGAAVRVGVDDTQQINFGSQNPSSLVSLDGTEFVDASGFLGFERAASESLNRIVGTLSVNAQSSGSVTHGIGRLPVVAHDVFNPGFVGAGVYLTSMTTTQFTLLNNHISTNRNVRYSVM